MKTCAQCRLTYPSEAEACLLDGASLVEHKDPLLGETLEGRYVIEAVLGRGGMATVYRAHHKLVELPCAIKVLAPQFALDATLRERFRREAQNAERLAHPNIIEIKDQGETPEGLPFLCMELLRGASLASHLERGALPLERALPIAIEMVRALACAHDFDVIHRDLKPGNVFLLEDSHVMLIDFGIARCREDARITSLGEVIGTPAYMAPELGNALDAGPASDLYAFGVMLYEMLVGALPFEAQDPAGWLLRHMRAPAPHLRVRLKEAPEALDRLVHALMAKRPEDRPMSAHSVEAALLAICDASSVPVPTPRALPPPPLSLAGRGAVEAWKRRASLFTAMLAEIPADPRLELRAELSRARDDLRALIDALEALQASALEEQRRLERIEQEGREARARLGAAMSALATEVSRAREEARDLRAEANRLAATAGAFREDIAKAHKEAVRWEGRSGLREPYRELASSYRALASIMDDWCVARDAVVVAEAQAEARERALAEADGRILSLRQELAAEGRATEAPRQERRRAIAAMGARGSAIEAALRETAGRICAPLRSRTELGGLFAALAQVEQVEPEHVEH